MSSDRIRATDLIRTPSRSLFPRTVGEVFDWADYMWIHFGRYSNALKNSVRYFLGDINISATDEETIGGKERAEIRDDLLKNHRLFELLGRVGDEYIQWGNSFTSIAPVLTRRLLCPECKSLYPVSVVSGLKFKEHSFYGNCTKCNKFLKFRHLDSIDESKPLKVSFWNPRLICINYCPTTKAAEYSLRLSETWKKLFTENDTLFLQETPYEFLVALEDNKQIKFKSEYFKHLKCPAASTYEDLLEGWGLPLFMNEFEKVIQLQMLEKYNEVIISDYMVPFRVIAPPASGGNPAGDPLMTYNLGDFRAKILDMISVHRKNPSDIQVTPFPLTYQLLGGEAKSLIPIDVIKATTDDLLSSMCIPTEFADMTLAIQGGPPIGLRKFEKVWGNYVAALDDWITWFCTVRTDLLRKRSIECTLVKSSIYEDDMSREYKTKLAMGGEISKETGLRPLGIDYAAEITKKMDEADRQLELDQRMQEIQGRADELRSVMTTPTPGVMAVQQHEQQTAAAAGAAGVPPMQAGPGMAPPPMGGAPGGAPGGAGGAPGGGQPADIDQLWAEAQNMAQQIMTMPAEQRRSQLINLSKTNPPLHAFVKRLIDQQEQQAAQQGIAAARQGQM